MSRKLFFTAVFLAAGFVAEAKNDSIQFTWNVSGGVSFNLTATAGYSFIIHWGDWEETLTGTGTSRQLTHMYSGSGDFTVKITPLSPNHTFIELDLTNKNLTDLHVQGVKRLICAGNPLTELNIACPALENLNCATNQLTSLILDGCTNLIYLVCANNQLTELNLNTNAALLTLNCSESLLSVLVLNEHTKLEYFNCHINCLQLSELYKVLPLCKDSIWDESLQQFFPVAKIFGKQNLATIESKVRDSIDFSLQAVFDDILTVFEVEKDGIPVPSVRYSVTNGKIVFKFSGKYTVTMTNDVLIGAKVIVEINVVDDTTNIAEATQNSIIQIYPNPATTKLYVQLASEEMADYTICSYVGQILMQGKLENNSTINIESLTKGIYFLNINKKAIKFIKN
ncbi:MAG: T9SS type A sorting domain-containing protein [Lentimicrobiaceae bacterium]|nr:T9SS type A sorting domain-containing protein [Lentimicrobiaceae bacterium]